MTVSSQVFDLDAGVVYVAAGQPCSSEYRAVGLPDA